MINCTIYIILVSFDLNWWGLINHGFNTFVNKNTPLGYLQEYSTSKGHQMFPNWFIQELHVGDIVLETF